MSNDIVMTPEQAKDHERLLGAMRRCRELAEQAAVEGDDQERRLWLARREIAGEAWVGWLKAEGLYEDEGG